MKCAIDTSVLVDALGKGGPHHAASLNVINTPGNVASSHILSETFSTLTGGRLEFRVPASQAASILKDHVAPRLKLITLSPSDLLRAYAEAESRGVSGGAVYDYLHLFAARKSKAERLYTLNFNDFMAFHRLGDPEILRP